MQTKVILAALAGTTFASQLQPRQTDIGAATACLSLLGTMPTPPPALTQEFIKNPPKDYCSITVPASLSSDWSSYTSAAASWLKEHSSDLSKCPGADQIKSKSPVDCKAANGGGSGSGSQTTGGSGSTNTASGAGASKTGAAARETGMAFAAVAAAGFALAAL